MSNQNRTPKCEHCKFLFQLEVHPEDSGLCRRFPPVVMRHDANTTLTSFPYVQLEEWCGEFQFSDLKGEK